MFKINITNKFLKELFNLYNNMYVFVSIKAFRMQTNIPKIN